MNDEQERSDLEVRSAEHKTPVKRAVCQNVFGFLKNELYRWYLGHQLGLLSGNASALGK